MKVATKLACLSAAGFLAHAGVASAQVDVQAAVAVRKDIYQVGDDVNPGGLREFLQTYYDENWVEQRGYPEGEAPDKAVDGDPTTKYLSFPGAGLNGAGEQVSDPTGLAAWFTGPSDIAGFQFVTGNDWHSRDPATIELYGITANINSATDMYYLNANDMTLIYSGESGIPKYSAVNDSTIGKQVPGEMIVFDEPTDQEFFGYAMIVTDLVDYGYAPTIMQFSEFTVYDAASVPEPAALGVLGLGSLLIGTRRRRQA